MTTELDWYIREGHKDVTAADLMVRVLVELNTSGFEELVKLSGKAEALAAVKPYRYSSGSIVVSEAKKKMPIQGNGPDALLMAYAFGTLTVVPPENVTGKVCEKGAVGESRNCLFKEASPEFCMFISHYSSEGVADALNPDYECIWTHHETSGDPYCRYVFKKKSDPISVLDDLGKTLFELPSFQMPKEQCQAAALWANGHFLHDISKAFADLHGEEKAREVLGANAWRIGNEMGVWLAENSEELRNDVVVIGKLVRSMENALGQRDNFVVISKNEVTNEITDCSEQVLYGEVCKQYESFFKGMLNAINPDYEMTYDKMITHGGDKCHWTIRKNADPKKTIEPIKALKLRYANGEISEVEYRNMKKVLEE